MKIVNLTPHEINIELVDGSLLSVPPEAVPARCSQYDEVVEYLHTNEDNAGKDIRVTVQSFGQLDYIPPLDYETAYIVSRLVAEAQETQYHRTDIYIPGPPIRDSAGRVVACKGLSVVNYY